MELKISCATCGKEKVIEIPTDKWVPSICQVIVKAGWIWQNNKPHLDIYCSKTCAL